MRNRRRISRRGPLIVYSKDEVSMFFAFSFNNNLYGQYGTVF